MVRNANEIMVIAAAPSRACARAFIGWREPQAFLHLVRAFYAARRNPGAFGAIFTMAAMYLHLGPFSRYLIAMLDQRIDAADEEDMAFLALPARADVDAQPILALTDGC